MRVAFVTNRPAYYRVPVFENLARRWETDYFFTATAPGRWWTTEHEDVSGGLNARVGLSARALYRALRNGSYDCIVSSLAGRTHLAATAAAAGFALFLVLGLVFDWWEQPPFGVFIGVLAGLSLAGSQWDDAGRKLRRGK